MTSKIALVYDRVNTVYGGAEQVLLALQKLYPQAVLFTSVYDKKKAKWAENFLVKTSFLQKIPLAKNFHRYLAFLMPLAFEGLDLSAFDIVISVTSAEAKGVITRRDQLHFCYLLTPPRYLYHYKTEYLKKNRYLNLPLIKNLAHFLLNYLEKWDQIAMFRPDVVVPIAEVVKKRAQKFYQNLQLGPVIYPPIDSSLKKTKTNKEENDYYLLVSRLVPYKNVESAILACKALDKKLIIVGEGPEEKSLKRIANSSIKFKKNLNKLELAKLYQSCRAVLSPGLDDFGIVALEGNLFGKPVIINRLAGASELIKDQIHGLHLEYKLGDSKEIIASNLIKSILKLEKIKFDWRSLCQNALEYDTNSFVQSFDQALQKAYKAKIEGKL